MAKTQTQIDKIHESRTAKPGKIYTGPKGVLYVGSKKGHLIQESFLRGDVQGTTLNSKISKIGGYTIEELEDLLESIEDFIESNGDKHFVFEQGVAASVWTIQHDLNKKPSVMVVDSGDNVVEGCEVYIDDNNMEIQFGSPFSGKAYLN